MPLRNASRAVHQVHPFCSFRHDPIESLSVWCIYPDSRRYLSISEGGRGRFS
ncbi:hypothetical protein PGR6_24130 [Pseudomonas sp. GR 6-02]|nr:hypothetical protein PGR6_24130 [Pseudomonas sp. GR 6-02]